MLGVVQRSEVSDPRAPKDDMEPFVAEIIGSCPLGTKRSTLEIKWNGDMAIGLELRRQKVSCMWLCANWQRTFLIAGHEMGDRTKPQSLIFWEKIASALEVEVDHQGPSRHRRLVH